MGRSIDKPLDHTPALPGLSWLRRNRGALSAVLLSAACAIAALEWTRHESDIVESDEIEMPITPPAKIGKVLVQAKQPISDNRIEEKPQAPAMIKTQPKKTEDLKTSPLDKLGKGFLELPYEQVKREMEFFEMDRVKQIQDYLAAFESMREAIQGGGETEIREKAQAFIVAYEALEDHKPFYAYQRLLSKLKNEPAQLDRLLEIQTVMIGASNYAQFMASQSKKD